MNNSFPLLATRIQSTVNCKHIIDKIYELTGRAYIATVVISLCRRSRIGKFVTAPLPVAAYKLNEYGITVSPSIMTFCFSVKKQWLPQIDKRKMAKLYFNYTHA